MLIEHHAHMALFLLHSPQDLGNFDHAGQIHRFLYQLADRKLRALFLVALHKVLFVDDADDIIKGFIDYGHTRIFLAEKLLSHLLGAVRHVDRDNAHSRRDYLVDRYLVEHQCAPHEIALLLLKNALVLDLVDDRHKLLFGHAHRLLSIEQLRYALFQQDKERRKRRENKRQERYHRRNAYTNTLRVILRDRLRHYLAEYQHHDRSRDRRYKRAVLLTDYRYRHNGRNRRHGDIHDIVADKYGCQRLVVLFQYAERPCRAPRAVLRHTLEADPVNARYRRFGR